MTDYQPPQLPLEVIYEDDALLVLNKPSGLLSVPGRTPEKRDSLSYRAAQKFGEIHVVHRLDMETSGLMVLARSKESHRHLSRQFQDRQTKKGYTAVVTGLVAGDEGMVDLPLICDWPNRPRQMVDHEVGKPSQTLWQVLARDDALMQTRVWLTPITGRSHQLRVHMMALGHAILGDPFYADEAAFKVVPRLCLHATHLGLTHPDTAQWLDFNAAPDF